MGADFTGATLDESFLSGDFRGAVFHDASLVDIELVGDLSGADFSGADLTGAVICCRPARETSFEGATLDFALLNDLELDRANFAGASLKEALVTDSSLAGANLSGAKVEGASFEGSTGLTDENWAQALGVAVEDVAAALVSRQVLLESRSDVSSAVREACQGTPVADAAPYDPSTAFHPIVLGSAGAESDDVLEELDDLVAPLGWHPAAVRHAQLVACAGDHKTIRTRNCGAYIGGGQVATGHLTVSSVTISVREAATGSLVVEREFRGKPLRRCPRTISGVIVSGKINIREAKPIDYQKIIDFLARRVGD